MRARAGTIGLLASAAAAALLVASTGCAMFRRPKPAAGPALPPGAERRAFPIPGHGALEIPLPKGWIAEASPEDSSRPSTIRIEPPGGSFVALLTPFWNTGEPEGAQARADAARLFAELARRNALPGAQEQDIPLEALEGEGVHGFWFGATDRSLADREPGPDEWRHVMQGAAAVGPLVLAFTLLDNAEGPQRGTLLEMIRAARHVDGDQEVASAEPMEADPGAHTVPLRVEIMGKPWAVLVDLPGFRMFKPKRNDDGTGVLVLGQDPQSGMVASVILRPAGGARDAAGCRDADLPKIRDSSELLDLRVGQGGAAARASYAIAAPGSAKVRQEHGHAWLEREGICANVHVSKVAPAPGDAEAIDRILSSARFGEDL